MQNVITNSSQETKEFAKKFAQNLKGNIIALSGELGAGKTVFVQGLAEALGIKDKIISPTFVLIRQHKIPNSKKTLYHIDLYRIEDKLSINSIGLEDLFLDPNAIVVIEWAEKLDKLPREVIQILIQKVNTSRRNFIIDNS